MAQGAIWEVHGEAMVAIIGEIDPGLEHLDDFIDPDAMVDPPDQDLPYGDQNDFSG